MKLKDAANIKFCLASTIPKDEYEESAVLIPTCLRKEILNLELFKETAVEEAKYKVDDDTLLEKGMIVVKRVCPMGATYIEEVCSEWSTYSCANSIIIKPFGIDEKYLACVLNDIVPKIIKSMKGTRLPALGRNIVDEIEIPDLPIEKQKLIGELWYKNIKVTDLRYKLMQKQYELNTCIIGNCIRED